MSTEDMNKPVRHEAGYSEISELVRGNRAKAHPHKEGCQQYGDIRILAPAMGSNENLSHLHLTECTECREKAIFGFDKRVGEYDCLTLDQLQQMRQAYFRGVLENGDDEGNEIANRFRAEYAEALRLISLLQGHE